MSSYHISDLERLTGIKANTIRIWERRYKLIEPHRTSTNIRFYDDDQARKLLKVSTLLAHGHRISKISSLTERQLNKEIETLQEVAVEDVIALGFINDLTSSMLAFDEKAFEKTFSAAVVRLGMYRAVVTVFYPFLKRTGVLWSLDEAMPVQEHFASALIRRKLISAIDGLPAPENNSKVFLLFLPEDEWHEIGLLLADYIVRSKGYKTIYLGQNLPLHNLPRLVAATKPSHIFTLFIVRQQPEKIEAMLSYISENCRQAEILASGSQLPYGIKKPHNLTWLNSPTDLEKLL